MYKPEGNLINNLTNRVMKQKELLAKCSERDQAFYDHFHMELDIKAFTENIEFKIPYMELVDYHLIATRHDTFIHYFTIEGCYQEDVIKFYNYLRDEIIEPGTISDWNIHQVDESGFGYYLLTITVA